MRYAILGDIHGNLTALKAVEADIKRRDIDSVFCVGDIVGYGAFPVECIETVRSSFTACVAGNHDCAAAGRLDVNYFNAAARDAVIWTREQLREAHHDYLRKLPLQDWPDGISLVHSSPCDPEEFSYLQTLYDAELAFERMETDIGFVGHSHIPMFFINGDPVDYFLTQECDVPCERQMLVNVGSVGQPRDLDPRACYVIYDDSERRLTMRRIEYDVDSAADHILEAGLPRINARRLQTGR